MKKTLSVLLTSLLVFTSATTYAIPTTIIVRVLSKGAKFVGTSMGGVQITLRNNITKEILAVGVTKGSTGSTEKIMKTAVYRNDMLSDEKSAKFKASIDIDEPTWVEVTAYGPLAQIQSANTASFSQWVIPGKHIDGGDAWLLELPGFAVDILAPPTHTKLGGETESLQIRANITMMCGCPIVPDGLWDAGKYDIRAMVKKNGERAEEVVLSFAGKASLYEALIPVRGRGVYEVTVYAYDASNGNTGIDKVTWIVE
jgi:hypothetical protein